MPPGLAKQIPAGRKEDSDMGRKTIAAALVLALMPLGARAQFSTSGDDPASTRWMQKDDGHFRIVYPQGLDSLADVYQSLLETWRTAVTRSTGMEMRQGRSLPVVLHAHSGISNGLVTWAPKRMELYTRPTPYDPEALSWERNLTVHESRHVSQMMLGYKPVFLPLRLLMGDLLPGALSAIYPGPALLEGDAVVTETALTDMGRGRDGDFLNYYMSAFDSGDLRNWYSWRYGSWRHYAPNWYALGYMTIAGTRVFYDDPLFMDNYFSRIGRNPIRFGTMRKEMRRAAGGIRFADAWDGIVQGFRDNWEARAQASVPFTAAAPVTEVPSWYEAYEGGVWAGDRFFAVRSGLLRSAELVEVSPDGEVSSLRPFSSSTSRLAYDPMRGRLYWSETLTDARWSLSADSDIRYIQVDGGAGGAASGSGVVSDSDAVSGNGHAAADGFNSVPGSGRTAADTRIRTLTHGQRLFNPCPSPDGSLIAAVEYPVEGGTGLVIIDAANGKTVSSFRAPDGVQLTEPAWAGDRIYVSAVTDRGMGIYVHDGAAFHVALESIPAKISGLREHDGAIVFSSDRTGVGEIYSLSGGEVRQLTGTRYGAKDPAFRGDTLYFTSLVAGIPNGRGGTGEGRLLYKAESLKNDAVDFAAVYRDPVAEALSAQERELGGKSGFSPTVAATGNGSAQTGIGPGHKPETTAVPATRYRKAAHLFRFHSWVPLSVEYDSFSSSNFDYTEYMGSVGATAFFQNDLGTAYGYLSYGYSLDAGNAHRHSGHINMTYSGLYPVIELKADLGGDSALQYSRYAAVSGTEWREGLLLERQTAPLFEANLRVYVPFRFNSGGWLRGITPTLTYKTSNSKYFKGMRYYRIVTDADGYQTAELIGSSKGDNVAMNTFQASISAYAMMATASSARYPRLGIGAQAGYHVRMGLSDQLSPGWFGYMYGYLPGLFRTQGLKLSALYHHRAEATYSEKAVNVRPRGFSSSPVENYLALYSRSQLKLTADYSAQFGLGERHLVSALFHPKYLAIVPHGDLTLFSTVPYVSSGSSSSGNGGSGSGGNGSGGNGSNGGSGSGGSGSGSAAGGASSGSAAGGASSGSAAGGAGSGYTAGNSSIAAGNLYSVGADIIVGLANFLWIPYDTEVGLSLNWNGGKSYRDLTAAGLSGKTTRFTCSLIFTIDF